MIILKIGGSVITNKAQENTFKKGIMDRLSKEIKTSGKKIMIVHGAGSFGHITAKKYGLQNGFQDTKQIKGFSLTHLSVQKLNSFGSCTNYSKSDLRFSIITWKSAFVPLLLEMLCWTIHLVFRFVQVIY